MAIRRPTNCREFFVRSERSHKKAYVTQKTFFRLWKPAMHVGSLEIYFTDHLSNAICCCR